MTKEELENAIREADAAYYKTGASPYSDLQYDRLKEALREMDPDSDVLKSLGEDHVDGFAKVKHERRMLSLEKVHEKIGEDRWADLSGWLDHLACSSSFIMHAEPKIDGMSAEALYVDGKLKVISTRGNGDEGDDITANVKHLFVDSLCFGTKACDLSAKFLIRGELYIAKDEFARINAEQEAAGLDTFKNARNLCAGTVKSKDGLQGRNVSFIVHDYVDLTDNWKSGTDMSIDHQFRLLSTSGFTTVLDYKQDCTQSSPQQAVEQIGANKDNYPFVIDGAVLKVMYPGVRAQLGETEHHPRWAVAFKFLPEKKETVINSITWQIGGKTGKAVPVGEIEPVVLDGTVVSRVSLANAGQMAARGIAPGVRIMIEKSGEIIPYVREVLTPQTVTLAATMPCPTCGDVMQLEEGKAKNTANYVCNNPNCTEKVIAGLVTAFGTSGLNVLGFGPETALALVMQDNKALTQIPHIARIRNIISSPRAQYPSELDGKIGDNLYAELQKAVEAPLHRWIAALLLPGIAIGTGKRISQTCKDWKAFLAALKTGAIAEVKPKQMTTLQEAFGSTGNPALLDYAWISAINPKSVSYVNTATSSGGKLGGKAFVVTGRFHAGRTAIEEMIPANGGILRGSVSKKTDYLVCGEDVGATKTKKAEACGTTVITELEFLEMIK